MRHFKDLPARWCPFPKSWGLWRMQGKFAQVWLSIMPKKKILESHFKPGMRFASFWTHWARNARRLGFKVFYWFFLLIFSKCFTPLGRPLHWPLAAMSPSTKCGRARTSRSCGAWGLFYFHCLNSRSRLHSEFYRGLPTSCYQITSKNSRIVKTPVSIILSKDTSLNHPDTRSLFLPWNINCPSSLLHHERNLSWKKLSFPFQSAQPGSLWTRAPLKSWCLFGRLRHWLGASAWRASR